jgi:hypothetical protein
MSIASCLKLLSNKQSARFLANSISSYLKFKIKAVLSGLFKYNKRYLDNAYEISWREFYTCVGKNKKNEVNK